MDECRKMVDKLEAQEDSESKSTLLQKLETKIVELQGQLRTVRTELSGGGAVADKMSPPPKFNAGGRGGRGAGRGYQGAGYAPYPARGYGRGRGYMGRGRGFMGRGQTFAPSSQSVNPFAAAAATGGGETFAPADLDSQFEAVGASLQADEAAGGQDGDGGGEGMETVAEA